MESIILIKTLLEKKVSILIEKKPKENGDWNKITLVAVLLLDKPFLIARREVTLFLFLITRNASQS